MKEQIQAKNGQEKPVLDYVEIEICEACNLKCSGCTSFCNIIEQPQKAGVESVRRDLLRMKELFGGIEKVRLMGGEPFLNMEYDLYAKAAREIFPDADLRIVSNGLCIPSLDKQQLARLREYNCSVDISLYPPTKKQLPQIKGALDSAGVAYTVSPTINFFFKYLRKSGYSDAQKAFRNCLFSDCHSLNKGIFAPCCLQWTARRYNKRFGNEFEENEVIDIHSTELTGQQIIDICRTPHDFCKNCALYPIPVRWKASGGASAKPGDWRRHSLGVADKPASALFYALKPLLASVKRKISSKKTTGLRTTVRKK